MGGGNSDGGSEPETYTVTITGTGDASNCYVSVNGINYTSAGMIEVEDGELITVHTKYYGLLGDYGDEGVFVDGVQVAQSDYSYTVNSNTSISLITTYVDVLYVNIYSVKIT